MGKKVEIKVGDYIFNKEDVAKGKSTILYRVDDAKERTLKKWNPDTQKFEVEATETIVDAYCWESGRNYTIEVRHDKNEWAVLTAETMKVLCA